jgi:adenylate cyclase
VRVKGKQQAETVYTLLGGPELLRQDNFRAFRGSFLDMRACYGGGDWAAARTALARCRRQNDFAQMTAVLDLYEARLAVLEADPPAANWEGVFAGSAPAHRAIA